jgi:hypothetical protein
MVNTWLPRLIWLLPLAKMLSRVNAFEISDIQGDETKAVLTRPSKCHSKKICTEYERLTMLCQKSLESWRIRREEFIKLGLREKVSDALPRLRADYAMAYSRLLLHEVNLRGLPLRSKIGGGNYASMLRVALDKQHPA